MRNYIFFREGADALGKRIQAKKKAKKRGATWQSELLQHTHTHTPRKILFKQRATLLLILSCEHSRRMSSGVRVVSSLTLFSCCWSRNEKKCCFNYYYYSLFFLYILFSPSQSLQTLLLRSHHQGEKRDSLRGVHQKARSPLCALYRRGTLGI